jgi:hypothetical protein
MRTNQKSAGLALVVVGIVVTFVGINPIGAVVLPLVGVLFALRGIAGRGVAVPLFVIAAAALIGITCIAFGTDDTGAIFGAGLIAPLVLGPTVAILGFIAFRLARTAEWNASHPRPTPRPSEFR